MPEDKEKDLILGKVPDTEPEDEDIDSDTEIEFFETPPGSYIEAAYAAICAVDGLDCYIKADKNRVARIKRRSIRIIDHFIGELYFSVFEEKKDEEAPDL